MRALLNPKLLNLTQFHTGLEKMVAFKLFLVLLYAVFLAIAPEQANCALHAKEQQLINLVNMDGPYIGIVVPNQLAMDPLIQHSSFNASDVMDVKGRRFRFGTIGKYPVIVVMSGSGMSNAARTTQMLLTVFDVPMVMHCGIAGAANHSLNTGDVVIPLTWAHSARWSWQRFGFGPDDKLPLEENGDYTREFGYIKLANYAINVADCNSHDNLLNNIWYQPEEVFPITGIPEKREHVFWAEINPWLGLVAAMTLQNVTLDRCVNSTTCLETIPQIIGAERGTSASIFVDNAAYASFLYNKFNVSIVDTESAGVALECYQQNIPFIAFRGVSDLAGYGTSDFNQADTFASLAAKNAATVVVEYLTGASNGLGMEMMVRNNVVPDRASLY